MIKFLCLAFTAIASHAIASPVDLGQFSLTGSGTSVCAFQPFSGGIFPFSASGSNASYTLTLGGPIQTDVPGTGVGPACVPQVGQAYDVGISYPGNASFVYAVSGGTTLQSVFGAFDLYSGQLDIYDDSAPQTLIAYGQIVNTTAIVTSVTTTVGPPPSSYTVVTTGFDIVTVPEGSTTILLLIGGLAVPLSYSLFRRKVN